MSYFVEQLLNGIFIGSTYSLVALGFTLIFGIMRVLNIAHGETLTVAAFVTAIIVGTAKWPVVIALVLGVGAAVLLGILIYWLVLRRLLDPRREAAHLSPLIGTMGISTLVINLMTLQTTSLRQSFPLQVPLPLWRVGGVFIPGRNLLTFVVAVAVMVLLKLWVDRTRLGRAMRASAENVEVAGTCGVNAGATVLLTMVVASMLGGVAGLLLAGQYGSFTTFMGFEIGLKGLIVMIIGGIGSLTGAMVVGVFLGVVESLAVGFISSQFAPAIAFGLLIVFLLVRPAGLFGVQLRAR